MRSGSEEALVRALIWAMADLGEELRLVDISHFITYIQTDAHANIGDIVCSSAELLFKEHTLTYRGTADMAIDWSHAPRIQLDMAFRHKGVTAKFELLLVGNTIDVNLQEITFVRAESDDTASMSDVEHLVYALTSARLKQPATQWAAKSLLN